METTNYIFATSTEECHIDFGKIYRSPSLLKRALNSYWSLWDAAYVGSYEITDFLCDIKHAQEQCVFYDTQSRGIELWKHGYNERQIAEMLNVSQQAVNHFMNSACVELSKVLMR